MLKIILKNFVLPFNFFIVFIFIGINSCYSSSKIQNRVPDPIEPEIGFISNNIPFDFLYTDGVYNNGKGVCRFEKNYTDPIQWDNFTLDFDFFTTKKREQWPIMMGKSTRSIGFLLKENRTIEITANNQKQIYQTQGMYDTNRWYHVKIVKFNNNTEIYLNQTKIGEFQIQIDKDAKNYFPNNISSMNHSNGIAFDGGLRNIIYIKKGDFEFSEKIYEKYASKYKEENLIFSKTENVFQNSNEYKLFDLNWNSFKIQFDYIHTNDESKLIIGDKWKIIDFHTINDTASISINNSRISYISAFKLEAKHKYKIEILINNDLLQMSVDDKVILNTKFEYHYKKMLERENEIFVISKKEKPSAIIKSLTVQNNVTPKYFDTPCLLITKNNSSIDTINEGALEALFIPPFEFKFEGYGTNDEFAFTKNISGFNTNSFEMNFDFLTEKKHDHDLISLGVYTKYSEIDLSILNNNLVFKVNNKKSTIIPIDSSNINENWNNCRIVYDNGLIKIYLNNIKTHEIKFKFSDQYYKSKLLTINKTFVGSIKNLYVYESAK
jgi:hypothetical protein